MIEYRDSTAGIGPAMLEGFFVGWPNPPSSETLLHLLESSFSRCIALDASAGQAIGFAYAISDGTLSAYIPLLEVRPEYQERRIGQELIKRLLESLSSHYMIDIVCDPGLEKFYSHLGFHPAFAMIQRNYNNQNGGGT